MPEPEPPSAPEPEPLERLRHAPLQLLGRIVDSSNATFLARVGRLGATEVEPPEAEDPPRAREPEPAEQGRAEDDGEEHPRGPVLPEGLKAVYKPLAGERPLWDFPEGLYQREVAAYELSVALGWDCIPGTVVRDDALGIGSLQRFVEADFARHYFVLRDDPTLRAQLVRLCVFDLLAQNTDRKGGHVLIDAHHHVWGIDNGLCFSTEARLRTVIWDFAGEPIPADLLADVARLVADGLPASVTDLLLDEECEGILRRARTVVSAGQLPHDPTGRRVPWPLI